MLPNPAAFPELSAGAQVRIVNTMQRVAERMRMINGWLNNQKNAIIDVAPVLTECRLNQHK